MVLIGLVVVPACAAASGYDPNRYDNTPTPSASADTETEPLPPPRKRPRLFDPRAAVADAGRAEGKVESNSP
jgi:hypothetical protein